MKNNSEKLLVIIPAYNECKSILKTVDIVKKAGYNYLIVDDSSYDPTDIVCQENNLNFIRNKKNLGLSKTMRNGFKYAVDNGYEYAVQFDGDGQHDINTIPEMLKYINDYDIILSNRFANYTETSTVHKEFAWKMLRKMIKRNCGTEITDPTCGLRMFNKRFMKYYIKFSKFEVEPSTIAFAIRRLKVNVKEVPTTVYERTDGESHFKYKYKIFKYMFRQIRRLIFTTYFWRYSI